jgi:hypothetical protein
MLKSKFKHNQILQFMWANGKSWIELPKVFQELPKEIQKENILWDEHRSKVEIVLYWLSYTIASFAYPSH